MNGHGDVVGLVDDAGEVLNSYTYDIWGGPLTKEETVPNVLRYAGEYWDDTVGLQYLRARWYDPGMARFIGEDTYEGELNDPLSLNLYSYVHNNPLKYVDPSGESKRPANNALLGLESGSGSSRGGRTVPGGSMGGGGGRGGSSPSSKPNTSKPKSTKSITGKRSINGLTRDEARKFAQKLIKNGEIRITHLKSMIPKGVKNTFVKTDTIKVGAKYEFSLADGQKVIIRWHSPDPVARAKYPASASGSRWTAQIKIGNKQLKTDGTWTKNQSLDQVHIPIKGK